MKAMYPGTFDPITNGHLDVIKRSSKLFDELIIVIMVNTKKNCTFDAETRKAMIEKCIAGLSNVKVEIGTGLTVDYAKKLGCKALIRGIRAVADYEYELSQATTNMMLDNEIETVFLVAKPEFSFLSSSVAKEIAHFNGDISMFIPEPIKDEVIDKLSSI